MVATATRVFECANPQCGTRLTFDMKALSINKTLKIVCPDCGLEWDLTIDGTSCCKVYVRFISRTGPGPHNSLVKVKSYSK
jgi:DNA-directed RNA polymerase subunit RPC12/RpoP